MYLMNFPDFNDSTVKNKVLDWIVFSQGDIHIGLHNLFYVDYTLSCGIGGSCRLDKQGLQAIAPTALD